MTQPPDKQIAYVQARFADEQAHGATLKQQANNERVKNVIVQNLKLLSDQPLLFEQNMHGDKVEDLDLASLADPAKAGKIGAQLQQRAVTIATMQKRFGPSVQMHVLLPQEVGLLGGVLGQATPQDKQKLFTQMRTLAGGDDVYTAMMQQIAPDHPIAAHAGLLALKHGTMTIEPHAFGTNEVVSGKQAALTLLKGEDILGHSKAEKASDGKPPKFPMPDEGKFRASFALAVGDTFADRPDAYDHAYQVAKAYYVGNASEKGNLSVDPDDKGVREAILATQGQIVEVHGNSHVLAPWGMDASTFNDKASAAFDQAAKAAGLPPHDAENFQAFGLRNVGDETYAVMNGRNALHDAHGRQIILTISANDAHVVNPLRPGKPVAPAPQSAASLARFGRLPGG
jgi:hypothetical protein